MLQRRLATEFVKAKMTKVRSLVKWYLWFNKSFTEQIMFKNNKQQLREIVKQHSAGEVNIQTELERMMTIEAEEIIRSFYDHTQGKRELQVLLQKSRGKDNILTMTGFDKKIKLKDMKKTWEFTRTWPMMIRLTETFFYILISQTQNIIYMSMIFSMYQNAGIISVVYPVSVFGYALLEETRPRKEFWDYVRVYTTFILFFKFIMNLSLFEEMMDSDDFKFMTGLLKIGIYEYKSMVDLTFYMMPEILIICFIMLNEIKLKLLGLYFQTEQEIEGVVEGIDRNIEKGDEEKVKMKKLQSSNMLMSVYFASLAEQQETIAEMSKIMKE